jgi:hypothetical protein
MVIAILELAECNLVSTAKMRLVALIVKFMNVITNLSLHSAVVNVSFFNRGQIVSRLLADVVGRCLRGYLLAICHQFRIKFRGLPSCSTCSVDDGY